MTTGKATATPWEPACTRKRAGALLAHAARCWFGVTVAGQLMFAAYIVSLYGGAAVRGDFGAWNKVMTHGHLEGASSGNIATGIHLLGAAFIMLSGALQLLPRLRAGFPSLHRWNGRLYLGAAVGAGVTGIYMVWWRGAVGDIVQHIGTTLNGGLILVCAAMALQRIRSGKIEAHRRWALRLFLAVSGVWFFRIGLMFWLALHGGPVGFDPRTFTGPFLSFLSFAQVAVPLAILELYLVCQARGAAAQLGVACVLAAATLVTGIGSAVAALGMWLPNM
ncbi:DUF2306 domain-containing protein [Massilia sp.]|uniref:DUF2306 domain-containing protein n=1 Tax=Massilia sp. TaxID=1882437 RepID=UPI00391BD5F8